MEGCCGEVVACGGDRRERMTRGGLNGGDVGFVEAKTGREAGLKGVWAGVVREDAHCRGRER